MITEQLENNLHLQQSLTRRKIIQHSRENGKSGQITRYRAYKVYNEGAR